VSDRSPALPTAARGSPSSGVHAHRVIFIDLARALAVVFMLYGHSVDALLAHSYRVGTWFEVWTFQRGLTSSLFLLLSGFAFSIATVRHWPSHLRISRSVLNRARRFSLFVVLGYALHFPVPKVAELWTIDDGRWRAFLAVDVLQLIGVSFLFIQLLVLLMRTRKALTVVALILASAVVLVTPALWAVDWPARLPLWASSYLEPDTGSLFPVFPWSAYILLGVGLGQIYARWGASNLPAFANRVLLGGGVGMVLAGEAMRPFQNALFGGGLWTFLPPEVLLRMGTCLLILGGIAHGTGYVTTLPRVFGALAQETLLIYFVHLCIVYGSIWGPGLYQAYGATLGPVQVLGVVLMLIASMTALAWQWNWVKHTSPKAARAISIGVLILLAARLI
jgi:acyltransferase